MLQRLREKCLLKNISTLSSMCIGIFMLNANVKDMFAFCPRKYQAIHSLEKNKSCVFFREIKNSHCLN